MAPPSLIAKVGTVMVSNVDGKLLLCDGRQIIAALAQVQSKFSQMSEEEVQQASWFGEGLLTILQGGTRLPVFQFTEPYERLRHQAVRAVAREQEQRKLSHTTLAQRAKVATSYYERSGSDWARARGNLVQVLGSQKVSTPFSGCRAHASIMSMSCCHLLWR